MEREGNLILAEGVVDDVKAVRSLLSREGVNHLDAHFREWEGFAHRDARTGKHELSLRQAVSPVEQRGYRVDTVQGIDYFFLSYRDVGSFVARVGDKFVVLWCGRSGLTADEQTAAKRAAAQRMKQAIQELSS